MYTRRIQSVFFIYVLSITTNFAFGENWVYRYHGPLRDYDCAKAIVYGADSNIYIAGISNGARFTIISLSTTGDSNWIYQYGGPGIGVNRAYSLVYGADNNIYAAGDCSNVANSQDLMVVSLSLNGDTNWIYRYNGPGNHLDRATSMVYGSDGNVYVAGYSSDSSSNFTVISLTTAGNANWVYCYDGPEHGPDKAYSIIYGSDGNIYAAGISQGYTGDFIVISLTTTGDTNWVYRYDGPIHDMDQAFSIVYGSDDNIYAAGSSISGGTSFDFLVISLTTAGDTNWTYMYNGPANSIDEAYSLVYGADDNIYAAGISVGSGVSMDGIVVSLTTAGETNWIYRYNGPNSGHDALLSLVYGTDDNIYIAGNSAGIYTSNDFTVISMTTAGDTNWTYTYDGPGSGWDQANSITYGADGNIYAAGYSYGVGTYDDFTVISLPSDLGVKEKSTIARKCSFETTVFKGPLILPKGKNCRVFDITGRVVAPEKIKAGIYFIEVEGKITQKIIKIK